MFKSPLIAVVAALSLLAPATALAGSMDENLVAQRHGLDMYKVEQFVDMQPEQEIDSTELKCNNGDYAVDGMWRVDQVNFNFQIDDPGPWGDWNRYNGVDVHESESVAKDTWAFSFENLTEEQAQAHIWITCLGRQTQTAEGDAHRHKIVLGDLVEHTDTVPGGAVTFLNVGGQQCAKGQIAVAPGFLVPDGQLKPFRSWPSANLRGWQLGIYTQDDPNVTTSFRCLNVRTDKAGKGGGHRHDLKIKFRTRELPVKHNFVDQLKVECGQTEKGLVGGYDIRGDTGWGHEYEDHKLWYIGQEPQIKSRVFHIWNHSSDDWSPDFGLICFDDRVSTRSR